MLEELWVPFRISSGPSGPNIRSKPAMASSHCTRLDSLKKTHLRHLLHSNLVEVEDIHSLPKQNRKPWEFLAKTPSPLQFPTKKHVFSRGLYWNNQRFFCFSKGITTTKIIKHRSRIVLLVLESYGLLPHCLLLKRTICYTLQWMPP